MAGHETTAPLYVGVLLIHQQPEVLDQLMRELEELGDADASEIAGPHISQLYVRKRYAFTPF